MTKVHKPLTQHKAMSTVADLLGWDTCADIIGMSESMTRKLGNPTTGRELKFRDAIRLDIAFREAGGNASPFLECFAARVGFDGDGIDPQDACVIKSSGDAAKETGEALSAALLAIATSDPAAVAKAVEEAEQGVQAMFELLYNLKRKLPGA